MTEPVMDWIETLPEAERAFLLELSEVFDAKPVGRPRDVGLRAGSSVAKTPSAILVDDPGGPAPPERGGDPDGPVVLAVVREKSERSERSGGTWPRPPDAAGFAGFAGRVVDLCEPYTEADRTALLTHFLVAFGNAVGREPHTMAGAERHGANLNAVVVGRSAKARKGSSWSPIEQLFQRAAPEWARGRIVSGLSSGEGLVFQVRDPVGDNDEGASDKRLLVVEAEFARVLKVMSREGNILSTTIRDAWDGRQLGSLTKNSSLRSREHHVSIVAHVTEEELRYQLSSTDAANGFGNRFLWVSARRSRLLPNPPRFQGPEIDRLATELAERVEVASRLTWIHRDEDAAAVWDELYRGELAREWHGLAGALTARSEAQTLRLSLVYALLDGSSQIRESHLAAAIAVWRYCSASVEHIFGNGLGDPIAERIRAALRAALDGLTRTEIANLFDRHEKAERIELALERLKELGLARCSRQETGGRPVERWVSSEP